LRPDPAFTPTAYTGAVPRLACLFLLGLACATAAPRARAAQDAQLSVQEAQAHALSDGTLLYREQHLLRSVGARPLERLVLYRCPGGGAAFARKHVDYAASAQAPAFAMEDARSGYREGMARQPAGVALFFRERSGAAEQRTLLAAAPAVADAGFDEFIRAHWPALAAGDSLALEFAVPALQRALSFRVRRIEDLPLAGARALRFRLRLDGLLGFVAPHIDVAYDAGSRRLLRFEGLANLRDGQRKGQAQVRIDFPQAPRPAAAGAWAAALSEPLQARCESGQAADSQAGRTVPSRA
jgi:hypothetical protein